MILWLNPIGGASGDMLLGALVDAGAPLEAVKAAVTSTGLTGWDLAVEAADLGGLAARRARVRVSDDTSHRQAAELLEMVAKARPAPVAQLAAAAVHALATAESAVHGVPVEQVHLHEVGGHDTVVDIVGVAAALHELNVTELVCAPLPMSTGLIDSQHGSLPVPAPAVLALLTGLTVTGTDLIGETVTPTAAALLRAAGTRSVQMPTMTVRASGYGAGTRSWPDRPNVLVAVLGERTTATTVDATMTLIETTVDDVTGEVLAYVTATLLERGAADTWLTPVIGKKGRPAQIVSVLCRPEMADDLQTRLLRETGSLGARRHTVDRHALPRTVVSTDVAGTTLRVKRGPYAAKPEFDDLAALARTTGRPLRELADEVTQRGSAVRTAAQAGGVVVPGGGWRDQAGGIAQLHGVGMLKVGDTYYAFGQDMVAGAAFTAVACYSSTDLVSWHREQDALSRQASGDLGPNRVVERPKVLYNASTKQYVMYVHIDSMEYADARVGVATSGTPCGPYSYLGSSQPLGRQSRDIGLYQDDDGSAYLLTEDREIGLRIDKLSADYLSVESEVAVLPPFESPALVKVDGTYYLFGSHLTGWNTNDNEYAIATNLAGPWSAWKPFAPLGSNTFNSQISYILPVTGRLGTTHVYIGDRWHESQLYDSTPVWLPIDIADGTARLQWQSAWSINITDGTWALPQPDEAAPDLDEIAVPGKTR